MLDFFENKIIISYCHLTKKNHLDGMYVSHLMRICFVLEGQATWEIGERVYNIAQNDVILLNNKVGRRFKKIDKPIKLLIVEFEPQLLYNTGFLPLFINNIKDFSPSISNCKQLVGILENIETEYTLKKNDYSKIIYSNLLTLLVYIKRYYIDLAYQFKEQPFNNDINNALLFIRDNFCDEITLPMVASHIHMSTTTFSKSFKKCNGINFSAYVQRMRIEKAIHLIKTTDHTMLSIAMDCGFNTSASFYLTFSKITGLKPNSFRQP